MDRDGVDAEVIFGILGVASRVRDHDAANEMLRIYNDWLKGFCSHHPGPSDRSVLSALRGCRRRGEGGLPRRQAWSQRARAVLWDMEPMWHPAWEPLWRAVNDVQLPLHFHTFPAMPASMRESLTGELRRKAQFISVAGFQMNLINKQLLADDHGFYGDP